MTLRIIRLVVAATLMVSGALLVAASAQRWWAACSFPWEDTEPCYAVQDHRFDFIVPSEPWVPIGNAAQLAGLSLLLLAATVAFLPVAFLGRRAGVLSAGTALVAAASVGAYGLVTLRSGLVGDALHLPGSGLVLVGWALLLPGLLVRLAFSAEGRVTRAGCISLMLAMPIPAWFSYALGPFDSAPWWEAINGGFVAAAGLCLLVAALRRGRPPAVAVADATAESGAETAVRATT